VTGTHTSMAPVDHEPTISVTAAIIRIVYVYMFYALYLK